MKVLQLNTVSSRGSVGRIVLDLYQIIKDNNDDCAVLYGRDDAPKDIKSIKVNSKLDFYSSVLRTFITGEHGFGLKNTTKRAIEKIKEYNPDVIHIHNLHGFYINIEELFSYIKEKDIPVVWTLHDCWSFTGHCAYFDYAGCNKWGNGCENCPQFRKTYPYGLIHDNSRNNYIRKKLSFGGVNNLTIVTPSIWLKDLVEQSFLSEYPVEVIYNGIDLNNFKPSNGELYDKYNSGKKTVLGVANVWETRKGLTHFEWLADNISDDYQIILVGVSEKQIERLDKRIIGLKRTANVNELAQLYTLADVYVNPTLEDNFPTTNIESLACGTPVITFNTGGSVEAVTKECGIIVEKGDNKSLKEAIIKICTNDKAQEQCVERAKMFDKKERFKEYLELYRELIQKSLKETRNK